MDIHLDRLETHIIGWHIRIEGDIDSRARSERLGRDTLQISHGFGQQVAVQLETDRRNVARLLVAEQIAGTAQLKIAHGDTKARTELGVVGERGEARTRLLAQLGRIGIQQIGMCSHIRPANATTDLVQLRQAEQVGALDDQRIGRRNVETRLDDRRRDQDILIAAQERRHRLFQFTLGHLTMTNAKTQFGAELAQVRGRLLDRLDAIVEIEGLSSTLNLTTQGTSDLFVVVLANVSVDWSAATWWRRDHRDIAQSSERHMQRARNGRGRECEHINLGAHLPQQFLLRHTKALLLVDDHQPEVGRDDIAREHAVRTK